MAVKDWLTFPKEDDVRFWVDWGTRANGWINSLVTCVNDLTTRLTTAEGEIDALQAVSVGTWTAYTPTVAGLGTATVERARYIQGSNKTVTVSVRITSGVGTAAAVTIDLPVTVAAGLGNETGWGFVHAYDTSAARNHFGVIKVENFGNTVTFQNTDGPAVAPGGTAAGVWFGTTTPFIWGSGDVLCFTMVYEGA